MALINTMEQLKEHILRTYDPTDVGGSWGDTGNYDDSYEYGQRNGSTWQLFEIGTMIGLDLEQPDEVEPV